MTEAPTDGGDASSPSRLSWAARGMRVAFGIPGLILFASMLGFGGLAAQSGVPFPVAVMMTGVIWALPSQVVLVGAITGGLSLMAATLAVALSAVRLLPMTVSLMPVINESRPPKALLFLASHFMAVTPWVAAMRDMGGIPPKGRVYWYVGLGITLSVTNTIATMLGYWGASELPPVLAAGLVFIMPVYFLVSLTAAAREAMDHLALALGLVATPLVTLWMPELDLLIGGVGAGTLAYGLSRMKARAR